MKNIKTFESFSKVNESGITKTPQTVIDRYKQVPQMWNMAKDQYYNIISGSPEAMEELSQYYPGWTIDNFKEVYLAMEGELPEEEM